jgi:hypothetical protein
MEVGSAGLGGCESNPEVSLSRRLPAVCSGYRGHAIDHVSGGRFLFGVGGGWNQDEIEDHGTVFKTHFKKMREPSRR